MSKLISGKEALMALANGVEVEYWCETDPSIQKRWTLIKNHNEYKLSYFLEDKPRFEFRLKPRTITLNGIEVPAPFTAPENLDNSLMWYVLDTDQDRGYSQCRNPKHPSNLLGSWIHEEEIKQVVAALRQVFRG